MGRKLAPHEYAKTAFSYVERDTSAEIWVEVPEQPDQLVEATRVLTTEAASASVPADGHQRTERRSAAELIADGESSRLEFKETAFWDIRRNTKDKVISLAVVKTVAGFMNQEGGTLLIGVNDQGEAAGLDRDYGIWGKNPQSGRDAFENALTTLFEETIGKPATISVLKLSWEQVDGKDLCRIDVSPSDEPVFVKNKETKSADFFVRMNNSTRVLNTEEALKYIGGRRWRAAV